MDHMDDIIGIVRSAIKDGLIKGETVEHFDDAVVALKGPALEDYLQDLWDNV